MTHSSLLHGTYSKITLRFATMLIFHRRDENGKTGLEIVLIIIDRLLGPTTTDSMALEVGGLAAEVVETVRQTLVHSSLRVVD